MIFVQIFVTNVLIYVMLKLIKLKIDHISVYMINTKKQIIVNRFNKKSSELITLMMSYVIAAMKLNFQNNCWRVHCFEQSHNIAIVSQTINRIKRLNNSSKWIYVYEYTIFNIFDSRDVKRNIEKIISQVFVELNQNVIFMKKSKNDENENQKFTTIDWIKYNEMIQKKSKIELTHENLLNLSNFDFFELIIAIF